MDLVSFVRSLPKHWATAPIYAKGAKMPNGKAACGKSPLGRAPHEKLSPEFTRRMNRDGTAPEKVKFAIAVPVYNYESSSVQIMQLSQKSLQNELDDISQMEDYANLLEWDFVLGKEGNGLETRYSLRPVPRKKGTQDSIESAWTDARAAGFDIGRLLTGENPFKAE